MATDLGQRHIHGNDFIKDKDRWFGFPEAMKPEVN
jgi:hypothetical protein